MLRPNILTVVLLSALFLIPVFAQNEMITWDGDSDALVTFLKSDNDNLKIFAMQQIILNTDRVKVTRVSHHVYNVFRNHTNDKVRQLALVTLYKLNHIFILKNLVDDYYSESNPKIRMQIAYILEKMPVLSSLP